MSILASVRLPTSTALRRRPGFGASRSLWVWFSTTPRINIRGFKRPAPLDQRLNETGTTGQMAKDSDAVPAIGMRASAGRPGPGTHPRANITCTLFFRVNLISIGAIRICKPRCSTSSGSGSIVACRDSSWMRLTGSARMCVGLIIRSDSAGAATQDKPTATTAISPLPVSMRELRSVVSAYRDVVLIGETSADTLGGPAAFYGNGSVELHTVFDFRLLKSLWKADDFRAVISAEEQAVPDGGWPSIVLSTITINPVTSTATVMAAMPTVGPEQPQSSYSR